MKKQKMIGKVIAVDKIKKTKEFNECYVILSHHAVSKETGYSIKGTVIAYGKNKYEVAKRAAKLNLPHVGVYHGKPKKEDPNCTYLI